MGEITFADLLAQETKLNPIAFYARLREEGSLIHFPSFLTLGGGWIVTDYDDAIAILKDPRFIKDRLKVLPLQEEQSQNDTLNKLFLLTRLQSLHTTRDRAAPSAHSADC
jgi:hypothetical protein